MDNTQPTLFDGDIGPVRYTFNVPGLSFKQYRKGCAITMQPLGAPKSIFQTISNLVLWIAIAVSVMLSIQVIRNKYDYGLFSILALLFAFLIVVGIISAKRRTKKLYIDQPSCLNGYTLILGEKGLKAIISDSIGIYTWGNVTDFANDKGIDYIAIYPSGFLWIPEDLEGYNSIEVSAFILQKIAPIQ